MLLVGHILCILSLCFIFPKEKFAYFHRRAKVDWVGTVGWEQKAVLGQTGFLSFPHCINYKFILCPTLLMVFLLSLKYSSAFAILEMFCTDITLSSYIVNILHKIKISQKFLKKSQKEKSCSADERRFLIEGSAKDGSVVNPVL